MLTPAERERLDRLTRRLNAAHSPLQRSKRLTLEELAELLRLHAKLHPLTTKDRNQ